MSLTLTKFLSQSFWRVCSSVLECVRVYCSVLESAAVCWSVLECVAPWQCCHSGRSLWTCHAAPQFRAQKIFSRHFASPDANLYLNESFYTFRNELVVGPYLAWKIRTFSGCRTQNLCLQQGMSYLWMSHVTHINESCHTYKWVMAHIYMSHVTRMTESCHIYESVMSYIWISHVTHTNESCYWYKWVLLHI